MFPTESAHDTQHAPKRALPLEQQAETFLHQTRVSDTKPGAEYNAGGSTAATDDAYICVARNIDADDVHIPLLLLLPK